VDVGDDGDPLHYAYTLRRNKVRQREASAQIR
jgi:hypothetical protein